MTSYDYTPRVIGHLCGRGHYDFTADSEFDSMCGSKWVAEIVVHPERPLYPLESDPPTWFQDVVDEAQAHLTEVIDAWRKS